MKKFSKITMTICIGLVLIAGAANLFSEGVSGEEAEAAVVREFTPCFHRYCAVSRV